MKNTKTFRDGSNAHVEGYEDFKAGRPPKDVERTSNGNVRMWDDAMYLKGYATAHMLDTGTWPAWYTPDAYDAVFS